MQTTRQDYHTSKAKGFVIGCVLILLLTGCGDKSTQKAAPPPPTVTVAEVAQQKIPIIMQFSGTITSVKTQAGTHDFVVGKDNKVESRKVVAGSSYKQQRVINDGLKHGEQVIIQGVQKARPGMAVKPETASSPKT